MMHSGISRAGAGARSSTARLGMRGGVLLRAELVAGRTRITELTCHPPLQVLRAHHVDPDRPDRASVILASPAGGILQGDELTIDIRVGPRAHLRVGTQSATRIYRAPAREARQVTRLEVDGDGSLQYLPDPLIPYAGSRFCSDSTFIVSDDGRLTAWEIVAPGRAARGEIHAFERFESVVEIARPDGTLLATDAVVLDPRAPIADIGALGGHRALGTLYVVGSGAQPEQMHGAIGLAADAAVTVGASSLPFGAGAWLRVLSESQGTVASSLAVAMSTMRAEETLSLAAIGGRLAATGRRTSGNVSNGPQDLPHGRILGLSRFS